MKTTSALPRSVWLASGAAACMAFATGCSSVIGSAYLRDTWLDAVEHAAESAAEAKSRTTREASIDDEAATEPAAVTDETPAADAVDRPVADTGRSRYTTLDEAVSDAERRLEPVGGLSRAARETLSTMLEAMPSRDWGVVVDEFTASLAAAAPAARPASSRQAAVPRADEPVEQPRREAMPAATREGAAAEVPVPPLPPSPPAAPAGAAAAEPSAAAAAVVVAEAIAPPREEIPPAVAAAPALGVQNACFAARVRGWGDVDRFAADRFLPGQSVIVYFELDQLASSESPAGHTTRVDARLRLVTADGQRLREWAFDPLEETRRVRRRDYFARYVLELPETVAAGPCSLEISVTDAVAGRTAQALLPLEILGP